MLFSLLGGCQLEPRACGAPHKCTPIMSHDCILTRKERYTDRYIDGERGRSRQISWRHRFIWSDGVILPASFSRAPLFERNSSIYGTGDTHHWRMAWAVRRLWQGDWHVARSFDLDTKKSLNIWNIMGFSLKHLEVLTSCSFIVKYFVAIKMLRFWNRSQGCWERDPLLTSSFNFLKKNLLHLSICPWRIPGCGLKLEDSLGPSPKK